MKPQMPPVGAPTPVELVNLQAGTDIDVFVDGRVRTGVIRCGEEQYDGEPNWASGAKNVLVPGYFIALHDGGFAGVKARNITRVHPRQQ